MKLSELIERIRLQVPNVKQDGVPDTVLTTLLNQACDKVNQLTKVYSGHTEFDTVADQAEYLLSANVPTYLGTDKRGLYFLDADSKWQDPYQKPKHGFLRFTQII